MKINYYIGEETGRCTSVEDNCLRNNTAYEEIQGNITLSYIDSTDMIVNITNCVGMIPRKSSLNYTLLKQFPYSNTYMKRDVSVYKNLCTVETRDIPGSVEFCFSTNRNCGPVVANCFAQYRVGECNSKLYIKGKKTDNEYIDMALNNDNRSKRLEYFESCLNSIISFLNSSNGEHIKNVVFPKYIGCDLGDINWEQYSSIINNFAKVLTYNKKRIVNVKIIRL